MIDLVLYLLLALETLAIAALFWARRHTVRGA
jgi:hypothetical protein